MANIYKNAKHDFTGTGNVSVYTVPENSRAIIKSILITDDSGSGDSVQVDLVTPTSAGSAVFNLFKAKSITSNQSLQLITEPLIMMEGEILRMTATTADRLFAIVSILEINREDL